VTDEAKGPRAAAAVAAVGPVDAPLAARRSRATIVDVAGAAGVSKSLASRALRGEPGVSEESRRRIGEAAEALGYRINSAARSLVLGVSGLVGVILNDIGNQHHTAIVAGVEAEARERGAEVILAHGGHSVSELQNRIDTMVGLRVDGLIIVSSWVPHVALDNVGREIPTVVVARLDGPPESIDTIASDDIAGARAAALHLLATGRRRIGYVTRSTSATSDARRRGVDEALATAGIRSSHHVLDRADAAGLRALLARREFDAVLLNNDQTAADVIRVARDLGISVPAELAVIGYDDTPLAAALIPTLSSVDQPQELMGRRAVQALAERQNGRTEPLREYFPPTLVVRDSSAPADGDSALEGGTGLE
jgi:DNA-binding LacI/PurR family transcriptional regulator